MKISSIFFAMFIAGSLILGSSSNSCGETIQDAIGNLLQTNPDIQATVHNRLARDQEVWQAKSDYYPTLDFSTGYGIAEEMEPDNIFRNPKTYAFTLRMNIFRGLETKYEVERQKARVNSEAFRIQGLSEIVALDGARVYLNVLRHRALYDLAKENLLIHERIYDQVKLRSESGVDRKADLDQIQGRLALAKSNVVVAEVNNIDAETSYQAVIGMLPQKLEKPASAADSLPASMEEAIQLAVTNFPTLQSAEADLDARVAQYEVAKSPMYPIIDLTFERTWEHEMKDELRWAEDYRGMVTLRFNIFRGFRDKARILETQELISEAEEIRNHTHRQTVESVRLSYMAFKANHDKLTHLGDYVQATTMTSEAYSKQWNIGKRTMLDLLDIEAELINAKMDLVNAQYDELYAQYRVLSGTGELVHTLGLQWPLESTLEPLRGNTPMDYKDYEYEM